MSEVGASSWALMLEVTGASKQASHLDRCGTVALIVWEKHQVIFHIWNFYWSYQCGRETEDKYAMKRKEMYLFKETISIFWGFETVMWEFRGYLPSAPCYQKLLRQFLLKLEKTCVEILYLCLIFLWGFTFEMVEIENAKAPLYRSIII